jgi:hypothetical protein
MLIFYHYLWFFSDGLLRAPKTREKLSRKVDSKQVAVCAIRRKKPGKHASGMG